MVDGNKRLGLVATRLMLRMNGFDLQATQDAKYAFILRIAKGELDAAAIAAWLEKHSVPYQTRK